jgi:hypothetical protein
MAKYLVKEESFINNAIVQPGVEVDYDPPAGTTVSSNLELVEADEAVKDEKRSKNSTAKA